jgi:archaellum component FlaC
MTPRPTSEDASDYIIMDLQNKFADIKNEVAATKMEFSLLKNEIVIMKNDYSKILDLLTKIHDNMDRIHTGMSKVVSDTIVNEAKLLMLDKTLEELKRKQETQSKWMWMVTGGGIAISFLISTAVKLSGAILP